MNFFKNNSIYLSLKEEVHPNSGFRKGQIGALYALSAHFIERADPAIISLPTGYGKTAVMQSIGFLLKASRILIIVPTSALRTQTAKSFRTLETLRRLSVLPTTDVLPSPNIVMVEERMTSVDQWEAMVDADVVITTPHSASPEIEGIVAPPDGFFDLVLIDEGHHSVAKTWSTFIHNMQSARHVLCSATPFRRDRLQLPGKLIFYYSLRKAVEEKAFGRVTYSPVPVPDFTDRNQRDNALIQQAVVIANRDRAAGFNHRLLIRTDKVSDAERLAVLYNQVGLRVASVSSRISKAAIAEIEEQLIDNRLDGVVCVDMFGEGYDFPKFKIAVLHVPHRSLVPTLQFIGRFARTNDQETGDATFIAIPNEINSESDELYQEGIDWDVLLADIADARQALNIREREMLQSFNATAQPSADYENIDPGQFKLPQHIAAYKTNNPPDFNQIRDTFNLLQITNAWKSDDNNTYLFLVKDVKSPVWSRGESLSDSRHDCFLIRYYPGTGIVFITATNRVQKNYVELLKQFFDGNASSLAFERVRKVLNGLEGQEFFSIGLRNTSPTATTETYRIVAGSQADRGVRDTDAAYFCQGHFFGRGEINGESEIIGASSGGRVWSNGKVSIPALLQWMDTLHTRIASVALNIGRSGLDKLPFGESLLRLPSNTITADWSKETYRDIPNATWQVNGNMHHVCLLDLSIGQINVDADGLGMTFLIKDEQFSQNIRYTPFQFPRYQLIGQGSQLSVNERDDGATSIQEWLEDNPLTFYTTGLDSFSGTTLNRRTTQSIFQINSVQIQDWNGCEIGVEFDTRDPNRMTVQRYLKDQLLNLPDLEFIIYDHRSGEAADYIVGQTLPGDRLLVHLYHCKGAGGGNISGERVDNVYELAGQAVKSVRFQRQETLIAHIDRRTQRRPTGGHSTFVYGDRDTTLTSIKARQPIDIELKVFAVQPGISAARLVDNVKSVMACANDSVSSQQSNLIWVTSP